MVVIGPKNLGTTEVNVSLVPMLASSQSLRDALKRDLAFVRSVYRSSVQ